MQDRIELSLHIMLTTRAATENRTLVRGHYDSVKREKCKNIIKEIEEFCKKYPTQEELRQKAQERAKGYQEALDNEGAKVCQTDLNDVGQPVVKDPTKQSPDAPVSSGADQCMLDSGVDANAVNN